jgi:hypothetical protein
VTSNNPKVVDLRGFPPLNNLARLNADSCKIKSLKFIHQKFPMLNIGIFKNNLICNFEEIDHIRHIEYFPEFDIRDNPLASQLGIEGMISAIVTDLEIYNNKQIKETGMRYKIENEKLKKQIELDDVMDGLKDDFLEDILNEAFADQKEKHKIDTKLIRETVEKAEDGEFRVDQKLIISQMDLNNKLVPLLGDKNNLVQIESMTKEQLVNESENYRTQIKDDYNGIRGQFRDCMNKVRYDELDTISQMRAQTAQEQTSDPYAQMKEEIKRLDREQEQTRKVRFGFVTSRSEGGDSDEELSENSQKIGKENDSMISMNGKTYEKLSMGNTARKSARNSLTRKPSKTRDTTFRSSAGFVSQKNHQDLNSEVGFKVRKKNTRAESARKRKLPPSSMSKDQLNELKERKMNNEKVRF